MDYLSLPAFCVNLAARPDRWQLVTAQFASLDWPVERQPGVRHAQSPYPALTAPQAGCLDSHKAIWRRCLDESLGQIAVFEDDVVFPSDFKDIFASIGAQLPPAWDVWLFHSSRAVCVAYSRDLVRVRGAAWGTHGYCVTQQACARLLALPDDVPVDCRVTQSLISQGGQVFGTVAARTLAFQRGDDSDIPDSAQVQFWRQQRQRFCR